MSVQNIEYETTTVAVSDLDCYYQALDSALQKFHTIRIEDINKVCAYLAHGPIPVHMCICCMSACLDSSSPCFVPFSNGLVEDRLSESCGAWRIGAEISNPSSWCLGQKTERLELLVITTTAS